jgi:hypothetical protein
MRAMLAPREWKSEVAIVPKNSADTAYAKAAEAALDYYLRREQKIPNKLFFMSPTGVREVSNYEETPSRIVMTDQQMRERHLAYDAIRGGLVKYEPPVKVITGYSPSHMIIDDPLNDEARGKKVKPVKKDYNTIGVRFLRGETLHKVYTYKVRKGAKVHLGQELVARTDRGDTVVVVVEIHKTPQDNGPYNYKFIDQKVAPL